MNRQLSDLIPALLLLGLSCSYANTIKFNASEWPPYTSKSAPGFGKVSIKVKETLKKMGMNAKIQFMSWERVIKFSDGAVAFFPSYGCKARKGIASLPIGSSSLGFAERPADKVQWTRLADLSGYRIGVVKGYYNSEAFDWALAQGLLSVIDFPDDAATIDALAAKKIDLAVIDPSVLARLQKENNSLLINKLVMNSRLLETKIPLYVCFRDNFKGKGLLRLFNQALSSS
ncbi:hypothetical protein AVI51_01075 [Piscirickettsia salmonis]|uniref:Bacterial extracellular solute-binding protein, family 3 n=1 Tax=Piscirickettsia salmonis TaxID=1238 RepID=A0A9Q6LK21_PISSA|nr:transporter substrate-binding domain-containing protein [Piscirickettsia salmonis]ALA24647.1 bacterial extracellular solute-binding s, 3 family protein [Piscirickettsia salmonis]APS44988.1 hypothetical protein AVI48_11805 [Piscirickettsia salmonis]APS48349.1 hypothetical protein AVI49_12410 [Piscirickettsia salmonis]APS49608.1 hypothetical protein AVI50_01110 [Piscirickettsia salmonis]APS52789.1 hypothetical protein AVI51_01075 [Piscirickettsia salmonis]